MTDSRSHRGYLLVTACYWLFTLSDGALRMLVLLHLHDQGRTPWALALVLLPYEVAGVFTNLLGGWLGARHGLKVALVAGLALQTIACTLLAVEAAWLTVPYVMATQVLSGVAKDLAKTAAKSYVKHLAPHDDQGLFRLVALLTGSKNAMKGLGFFAGGALLAWAGFRGTNLALACVLAAATLMAGTQLPALPGSRRSLRTLFDHDAALRWLALARAFLFGSRDVWFAVALPVFLVGTLQWSPPTAGAWLAAWVIGYGVVQALAPAVLTPRDRRHGAGLAAIVTLLLVAPLGLTMPGLLGDAPATATLVTGLCLYGLVFATASSLHSWLVVALAGDERTAEGVGFYYAANSAGRVAGTLVSGWLYQAWGAGPHGLLACMVAASASVLLATACTLAVRRAA